MGGAENRGSPKAWVLAGESMGLKGSFSDVIPVNEPRRGDDTDCPGLEQPRSETSQILRFQGAYSDSHTAGLIIHSYSA